MFKNFFIRTVVLITLCILPACDGCTKTTSRSSVTTPTSTTSVSGNSLSANLASTKWTYCVGAHDVNSLVLQHLPVDWVGRTTADYDSSELSTMADFTYPSDDQARSGDGTRYGIFCTYAYQMTTSVSDMVTNIGPQIDGLFGSLPSSPVANPLDNCLNNFSATNESDFYSGVAAGSGGPVLGSTELYIYSELDIGSTGSSLATYTARTDCANPTGEIALGSYGWSISSLQADGVSTDFDPVKEVLKDTNNNPMNAYRLYHVDKSVTPHRLYLSSHFSSNPPTQWGTEFSGFISDHKMNWGRWFKALP